MATIIVDGVQFAISELVCSPPPPADRIKDVRFRIAGAPDRRLLEAAGYIPLEIETAGRRYHGLFRLVTCMPLPTASEYHYSGSANALQRSDQAGS